MKKTVVIVHANEDRVVINDLIRAGLKENGSLAKEGLVTNRLISKGLTQAEHKLLHSYEIGDVVKLNKEYFTVQNQDKSTRSVLLQNS